MGELVKINKGVSRAEQEEFMNDNFQMLIEAIMPKITPMIKPASKKFTDFMNEGKMILIKPIEGIVHVFILNEEDVEDFELKEGKEPVAVHNMEEFLKDIISGKFNVAT
jgi:hypothetical protein